MIKIITHNSSSENHYRELIPTEYLGLKHLFQSQILKAKLIEVQILFIIFYILVPGFLGYLLTFIVLATMVEIYPQNKFVGTYNYDSTTNYQFNPILVIIFVTIFGLLVFLTYAQIILAIDLKNASLKDKIIQNAVDFVQENSDTTLTTDKLRQKLMATVSIKSGKEENYLKLILSVGLVIIFFMLVIVWILIKS